MKPGRKFFTAGEAADTAGGVLFSPLGPDAPMTQNFSADSRNVKPGDGFIAIRGAREDGHDYIASAADSGASCVILESGYYAAHSERLKGYKTALIAVRDPQDAACAIARAWLCEVSPRVIGITGSVGKTTTRGFIYDALRKKFRAHAAIKSYNTLIGVSMTIMSMPGDTEALVLELGTNHPGEIGSLVRQFPVTYGIITEVADAHLEGLGDINGVLAAKMEIAESPSLEYLSYNSDNDMLSAAVASMPEGEKMKKGGVRQIGVGYSNSRVRISDVRQRLDPSFRPVMSFTLAADGNRLNCEVPIFGRQHAKNIAFAWAASRQMGIGDEDFLDAASRFRLQAGRGVFIRAGGGSLIIDETYNSNPSSVSCAIKNVLEMEIPRNFKKAAILGGMRELGAAGACCHDVVLSRASLLDCVYLVGREWREANLKGDFLKGVWDSTDDLLTDIDASHFSQSVILIKGSRFYGLERAIPVLGGECNGS
ncbi:MAG: UDP-N-acetylmuramoyl-tripeptide--D-alanyl-D-alanine ligase [Synergistaceae bacterium]|nr:UDP-N-acetylmuramoyl-tripeptide--D-alanyl-D-alanine ligase [Synergistaceae bacterium]